MGSKTWRGSAAVASGNRGRSRPALRAGSASRVRMGDVGRGSRGVAGSVALQLCNQRPRRPQEATRWILGHKRTKHQSTTRLKTTIGGASDPSAFGHGRDDGARGEGRLSGKWRCGPMLSWGRINRFHDRPESMIERSQSQARRSPILDLLFRTRSRGCRMILIMTIARIRINIPGCAVVHALQEIGIDSSGSDHIPRRVPQPDVLKDYSRNFP